MNSEKIYALRGGLCLFAEKHTLKCLVMNRKCYIDFEPENCLAFKNEALARRIIDSGFLDQGSRSAKAAMAQKT